MNESRLATAEGRVDAGRSPVRGFGSLDGRSREPQLEQVGGDRVALCRQEFVRLGVIPIAAFVVVAVTLLVGGRCQLDA